MEQTAAVLPPSVVIKRSRSRGGCAGTLRWRGAGERAMNAIGVVIISELLCSAIIRAVGTSVSDACKRLPTLA